MAETDEAEKIYVMHEITLHVLLTAKHFEKCLVSILFTKLLEGRHLDTASFQKPSSSIVLYIKHCPAQQAAAHTLFTHNPMSWSAHCFTQNSWNMLLIIIFSGLDFINIDSKMT